MTEVQTRIPSGKQETLIVAACALVIVAVVLTLRMQADTHRRLQEFDTRLNLSDGRNGYSRPAAERVSPEPASAPPPAPAAPPAPVSPPQEGDPSKVHIPRIVDPPPGAVVQRDEQ